jgi:hypothetical protein
MARRNGVGGVVAKEFSQGGVESRVRFGDSDVLFTITKQMTRKNRS